MTARSMGPANRKAFDKDANVWLCLTTLHHRRFVEDAIHVTGLPSGARLRLRYRRPYVDEGLWAQVSAGQQPKNVHVLVALAGSSADEATHAVQPLRNGHVVRACCEGAVMVIDVSLGEFVLEIGQSAAFENEMRAIAPAMPTTFQYRPGAPNTYLQPLRGAPESLVQSGSIDAWERIAKGFFHIASLGVDASSANQTGVSFLYFIQVPARKLALRLEESGAFDVEAGRSLRLEVHTLATPAKAVIRDPIGEVLLDLSNGAASFTSSRRVRIDSRRDVRTVSLATSPLFRRAAGHLSIRTVVFCDPKQEGEQASLDGHMRSARNREEVVVARYDFPLKVGRLMPWLASGLIGAAAALAAFKIPDQGSSPLATYVMPALAFTVAFFGVSLGLRGNGGR